MPTRASNRLRLALTHRRSVMLGILLLIFVAFVVGGILTRGGDPSLEFNAPAPLPSTNGLVDQSPLRTARMLATTAAVPEEQQYAQQALQLSDSEVDQAFAAALRNATEHAPPLTGASLKTSRRIQALTTRVHAEQAAIAAQTRGTHPAGPSGSSQGSSKDEVPEGDISPQLQMAQAQLALDIDELDDLHQTLVRLGGDRHALIQQALDEHEAVHKQGSPGASGTEDLESASALRSLPGKLRALGSLHDREQALVTARREALASAATLLEQHDALGRTTEVDPANNTTPAAAAAAKATDSDQTGSGAAPALALPGETITHLRALAADHEFMAQLEHRIHDEQGLADVYGKWAALLVSQQRTLHHRVLRVLASIVAVLILVFMVDTLIRSFFARHSFDRKRMQRMRFLFSFGVQAVGALVILFFIFGAPSQMPTIIGLATAGFTVVMKDFIVAFFGWFVLMGRNGVRVGDWVEINGVGGEVVDVGMLRTTLLETGNWAESGRPTGRRVAFMNSYAIEGHFFNFSTTGQWMWEELRIPLPANTNAYAAADSIRATVLQETRQQTAEADAEWAHATRQTGASGFSAQPTIDLRPGSGIEVIVRYITRIQDRHDVRSRLYSHILAILHGPAEITERALVGSGYRS